MNSSSLLTQLLARGDHVAIERGRLVIRPASGQPVPDSWLTDNQNRLIHDVLTLAGVDAFRYIGYTTGQYGGHKSPGVTLQMTTVLTGESRYAIFNASTKRERNSKKGAAGAPLPKGRFIPSKGGDFAKLWKATGLPCRALSAVYQSMGRLEEILFTGRADGERVIASTLAPLTITADTLRNQVAGASPAGAPNMPPDSTVKQPLSNRYASVKQPLRPTVKETQQSQQPQELQQDSGTGPVCYGKAVIRECGYTGTPLLSEEEQEHFDKVWTDPDELENAYRLGWYESIHGITDKSRKP